MIKGVILETLDLYDFSWRRGHDNTRPGNSVYVLPQAHNQTFESATPGRWNPTHFDVIGIRIAIQ